MLTLVLSRTLQMSWYKTPSKAERQLHVDHLPSMCQALCLSPNTLKIKHKLSETDLIIEVRGTEACKDKVL